MNYKKILLILIIILSFFNINKVKANTEDDYKIAVNQAKKNNGKVYTFRKANIKTINKTNENKEWTGGGYKGSTDSNKSNDSKTENKTNENKGWTGGGYKGSTDSNKSNDSSNENENNENDDLLTDFEEEPKTCEAIFGKELLDMIQSAVNIVKVGIPIMLIVFGVIDFGKAILSSDESEMKNAQGRFIKRLIIGISFFLIPTLIDIVLTIGHDAWGDIIGTDICGIIF